MHLVQPIRDKEKLQELKEALKKRGTRDYLLFETGINSGLRISDIIKLNRDDIRDSYNAMKSHITLIEKKTKKLKKFPICNNLYIELEQYTKNMKPRGISF